MIRGKRLYGKASYRTWAGPPPRKQALINASYVLFILIMQARMKSYLEDILLNGITITLRLDFQELSR